MKSLRPVRISYTHLLPFLTNPYSSDTQLQVWNKSHDEPFLYISQTHHMCFSRGNCSQPTSGCLSSFFKGKVFFHTSSSGLQSPLLSFFFLSLFLLLILSSLPLLWHWLCLLSPLPYVHTLFNNLSSENAIIECLSIQPDHRDMLFLPISFAQFTQLNNVCLSGTSTLLDAGSCRWESSVCQVCH